MIVGNAELLAQQHFLIGITRVRNEALILGDTLDFVSRHVDAIIAYDDASTDRTVDLLRNHPKVALILANGAWEPDVKARRMAEHRHRQLLLLHPHLRSPPHIRAPAKGRAARAAKLGSDLKQRPRLQPA